MNENKLPHWAKIKARYKLVAGFYNPTIILTVLLAYLIIYFSPVKFAPDYWHLNEIENLRTFIWGLFTVTLGFSGLILTLLLLSYNFYIKSTKRNTIEFIFENVYLRVLFSGFFSIILVLLIAYCSVNSQNRDNNLAVIYFLLILTGAYILGQLPLAILGLRYSTSIDKIDKVLRAIDEKDIEYLVNPSGFFDEHKIEEIESNRIILLKDIGLNAIKDGDWILPQKILNEIYNLIPESLNKECPLATLSESLFVYLWVSKHFQRSAIKNADHITVNVIVGQTFLLYEFLASNKNYKQESYSQVDDYVKELMYAVILSKDFGESRDHWVRDFTEMMVACAQTLEFDDAALPTTPYVFKTPNVTYPTGSDHYHFWFYLTNFQMNLLVEVVDFAMQQKDDRVYKTYHWQIRYLMGRIGKAENLTDYQKRDYLKDLLYKTSALSKTALDNGLYEYLPIASHIEIEIWLKNGWNEVYYSALYDNVATLKRLIRTDRPYSMMLDEFFLLGRSICNLQNKTEVTIKQAILGYILETGLKLYENRGDSKRLQYDLQYQLKWLYVEFIANKEEFQETIDKYGSQVTAVTDGFDLNNYPD